MYDGSDTYDFEAALAQAATTEQRGDLTPTRDGLVRHIERFGPEGVEQVAEFYGIDLAAKTRKQTASDKRRASGLAMLDEGKSPEQVAAVKGVSVETVRRWQREAEGLPKGVEAVRAMGQKRRMVERQKVQR